MLPMVNVTYIPLSYSDIVTLIMYFPKIGMSADLGLRLLAPTPGARNLVKTLTKASQQKSEDEKKLKLLESKPVKTLSASDLIRGEKQKRVQVKGSADKNLVPSLGRGFGSGISYYNCHLYI